MYTTAILVVAHLHYTLLISSLYVVNFLFYSEGIFRPSCSHMFVF